MLHVASILHFHMRHWPGMAAMHSITMITDDLENRESNAAEIHGVHPKWAYGGSTGPGTEGAF